MKNNIVIATLFSFMFTLFAFVPQNSTITGRINPQDGAEMIWVINSTSNDSTSTTTTDGKFTLSVKAATYRVVVIGKSPYKNTTVENVVAREGETTDTGEITLSK